MRPIILILLLSIYASTSIADTQWITKKNTKSSKIKTLEQMYVDGLLSRNECIKAKKKILKNQTIPGCKKLDKDTDSEVTYIAKKKKEDSDWRNEFEVEGSNKEKKEFIKKKKKEKKEFIKKKKKEKKEIVVKKKKEKKKKLVKKVEKFEPDEVQEDTIKPIIKIDSSYTFKDPEYTLKGKVTDKGGSEKFYLFYQKSGGSKKRVKLDNNGNFEISRFSFGEELKLIATDEWRNETTKVVKIFIEEQVETEIANKYEKPEPFIRGERNSKRIAIIIGVEKYDNAPDALYSNKDAEVFQKFAHRTLGISTSNIKVLIENDAKRLNAIKVLKKWLPKKITTPNEYELFVFYSGHGYPSENQELYLIPQDGDPELLEESALSHKNIVKLIQKTKPKSVTMFIDACYSGQSKTGEVLVAGLKQLSAVEINEGVPKNFSVFSSSQSNKVSGTIKEAEHGIFSYYLMKGLAGDADLNSDRKITNKELFVYLQDTVSKEAFTQNREQEPILASENLDQILVKY